MKSAKSKLNGIKVAFLATDGFEEVELTQPREVLDKAGAETFLITPKATKIKSWQHTKWGKNFKADGTIKMSPRDFDALVLPGGVINPDKLRSDKAVIKFIKHFVDSKKPIAAICHGPWTLVETGLVKGKTMTSYRSLKTDLENAGAKWVNKKVVRDKNLITSRKPDDLPAFNKMLLKVFAE